MTVLLLDARWPTLIPVDALAGLSGPVNYTDEVPVAVRWHLGDLISGELGKGVLVSTDETDAQVVDRIAAGERVVEVASRQDPVARAMAVMSRARTLGEWEAAHTHRTLLPYLAEESAEFAEAVDKWEQGAGEEQLLRELGDVLLQVLFHAEIASRRGAFDFGDVAASFVTKMRSRSPYLFDGTTEMMDVEEQHRLWAEGKENEKLGRPESTEL
ncbi:MazG nucleotide pyrophosphohydrolase domain-containing protein [Corynebacterium halotolerans]|uniref:MazG nucleotide pyrophosphohydrolase domain-containing protein n=1 Tax=Corynebacterium halotolerans TaxID=225326 RepID=UPI003CEC8C59